MTRLRTYLRTQRELLGVSSIPLVIMSMTFFIYMVEWQLILLIWCLSFFTICIYLVIGYGRYQKERTNLEKIEDLEKEKNLLEYQLDHYRNETENYFLTWLHQMKTPITASQLLLRDTTGDTVEDLKIQLTDIEKYTDMALSYVKLLNPGTDLEFVRISLDNLIAPLLRKYRYLFIYRKIQLEYDAIEHQVLTDANWSKIMVEQLLSNALKYTPVGGKIRIYYQVDDAQLVIEDNGIGIQEEDLDKIFDKGYVGMNGRLQQKASGLGLYLVRLISKRLNQEVKVTSELNKGSKFILTFNLTEM